jgi:uncharacterized membrane protein
MNDLSFRSLWAESVATYKAQFKIFLSLALIAFVIDLPWMLYNYLASSTETTIYRLFNVLSYALSFIYGLWAFIALTQAVVRQKNGGALTFGETLAAPRPLFWRVIAVSILSLLVLILPLAVAALFIVILLTVLRFVVGIAPYNLFLNFVPLMLMLPLILMVVFVYFSPTSAIIDGGLTAALKRSRRLIRGRFWRTLGLLLLLSTITQAPPIAVDLLETFKWINLSFNWTTLLHTAVSIYGNLIFPLTVTFTTLLYLRLREKP